MTKEERENIIRDAIDGVEVWTQRNVAYSVRLISDAWENDVEESFMKGQQNVWDSQGAQG